MLKEWSITKTGFTSVEALLAASLLALMATAFVGAYLYGEEVTALAGKRARATMIAEEGLEATRNMRDAAFTNLADGTHGLSSSGGQWSFSGTTDTIDVFTRQLVVSTIDSNRKSVTSTVTWQQNPQRTGAVSLETDLDNWLAATGGRAGMLVYGDGGTTADTMIYRVLSASGTWSAPTSMADIDGGSTNRALRSVRIYSSATGSEKIVLSRHYNGTTQYLYAQVYNGTSWGHVQLLASWTASTFMDVQNFDGTYLANGNFMAVYSDNSTTPKSYTWNGTSWSGPAALTSLGSGQIPNVVVAKARPGTNEVMTAFFTQASDAITEYYSGSSWSAITSHATAAPVNTKRLIDFDWSPSSATIGGLVFSRSATDRALHIKIWTANGSGSGSWSAVANTGNQGAGSTRLATLAIVARPGANEFIACSANTVPQIVCYKSTFTPAWTNPANQIIAAATDTGLQRPFHIGFEQQSGAEAIAVYSNQTSTPQLKKYNASTSSWDAAATSLSVLTAALESVRLIAAPASSDIMILFSGTNQNLSSAVWDGASNSLYVVPLGYAPTAQGTSGTVDEEYWYDFTWD